MARIDLTEANGYIPEEEGSSVIQATLANSVIESYARRESMATRTKSVPRFSADAPEVVAEGDLIPDATANLDEVILTARKYAKIFHVSEEDVNDSLVDVLTTYKREWASRWARKFDNACLGVANTETGTDEVPFTSLFAASIAQGAVNMVPAFGTVSFDDINATLSVVETGDYFDPANTIIVVHPKMLSAIRGLVDGTGQLVLPNPLAGTPGSLFGYPLVVSHGAATSSAATDAPTGDPLMIIGNKNMLINGVRGGVESVVSRDAEFSRDGVLLKTRVRRGFQVADALAFGILRLLPAE